jgi:hypothetical protein
MSYVSVSTNERLIYACIPASSLDWSRGCCYSFRYGYAKFQMTIVTLLHLLLVLLFA